MERIATTPKAYRRVLEKALDGQCRSFRQVKFGDMTLGDIENLKEEANAYVSRLKITAREKAKLKRQMNRKLDIWIKAFGGEETLNFFNCNVEENRYT